MAASYPTRTQALTTPASSDMTFTTSKTPLPGPEVMANAASMVCIPIAIGGHKLLHIEKLKSTIWVYISAIMGVSTVMLCGVISPFTWFAVGFGIWTIISLNNPDVQQVIEDNARGDRSERRNRPTDDREYRDDAEL